MPLVRFLPPSLVAAFVAGSAFGAQASIDPTSVTADASSSSVSTTSEPVVLEPESGFQHALRLGVALAAGESSDGRSLGDDVAYRVPVVAELGYRASHTLYVGLMGVVGIDGAHDDCGLASGASGAACTVEGLRLGAEVLVYPLTRQSMKLWVGGALGWERFDQKAVIPPAAGDTSGLGRTLRMVEHGAALDLQVGIDFPVEGKLALGPFAGYAAGMFVTRSVECPAATTCPSEDVDAMGIHHWLSVGARGTFGP